MATTTATNVTTLRVIRNRNAESQHWRSHAALRVITSITIESESVPRHTASSESRDLPMRGGDANAIVNAHAEQNAVDKSNHSTGKKKPQTENPVTTDPLKLAASTTSTADCAWSGAPKTTTTSATSDHS